MPTQDHQALTSFYIIKPEVFEIRETVRRYLEWKSGLTVKQYFVTILKPNDIEQIYRDDIGSDLMSAIQKHMFGKRVEVGIVEGIDADKRLFYACGTQPHDNHCEPGTVRWVFGLRQSAWYDGVEYYLNAVHKASTYEIAGCVKWFYQHYKI